jgi:diadenylate cyclase
MMLALAFPLEALRRLDARAVVDILIVATLLYYVLNLLRGTRAVQIAVSVMLLLGAIYGARWARLEMVEWLLNAIVPYLAIALIVLFQPEIRRALARVGRNPFWQRFSAESPAGAQDDVVLAATHFSHHRIGTLIVIEREVGLRTYIESGIPLDAALTYDLLVAIFHPQSPLHDGAAILQGNKVAAAACFLPLSLNPMLSTQLGTRHRAAIGVTEESDAIAVVVSEQTGAIALAAGGSIEQNLTPEQLAERLTGMLASYRPAIALPEPAGGARTEAVKD